MIKEIALQYTTNSVQNHFLYFQTLHTFAKMVDGWRGGERVMPSLGKRKATSFIFLNMIKYFCVVQLGLIVHIPDRINILRATGVYQQQM